MIKKYKGTLLLTTVVLLIPMLVGIFLWDRLPEQVPVHWNAAGEVDDWGSRALAVFGFPSLMLAVHWLCVLGTSADPKSKGIGVKHMTLVLWICPVLSLLCHTMMYATALGYSLSVQIIMPAAVGLVFMIIGNYLPKCKQNYTVGIKIPWTLNNEENWNRTHRFAGWVWTLGGAVIAATSVLGNFVLFTVIAALITLVPIVYSYLYYRKHS